MQNHIHFIANSTTVASQTNLVSPGRLAGTGHVDSSKYSEYGVGGEARVSAKSNVVWTVC